MFGIGRLWNAIAELVNNLTSLSQTVREIDAGLRAGLRLDGPPSAPAPELPFHAGEEEPAAPEDAPATAPGSNGRRRRQPASAA